MLYDPEAARRLRQTLKQFPRAPVAYLPTPLNGCPRLSEAYGGPDILMKRDDLTGSALGGCEARQFSFSLGPAISEGYDYLVCAGDSQSNIARHTAVAAAELGLKAVVVIARDQHSYPTQGNLLINHLMGAKVRYVFPTTVESEKNKALEQLRIDGHKPYDMHADNAVLRSVAYVEGALELCEQLAARNISPQAIYTSSRLYTLIGLTVGLNAINASMGAVGINYWVEEDDAARERLVPVANECATLIGLDRTYTAADFEIYSEFAKPDFGEPSGTSLETFKCVPRLEGILLDPTYTSKAMDGLRQHIEAGRFNKEDTVVFLHTGGVPSLFAYSDVISG
ncbi:MAG: pyridoxal-phosphate dependent enzyme [Gemmatimonadota bacterium]|nr:pyridoxal-phosphate dependent enzyme [Gemmatimonadota bacterium]